MIADIIVVLFVLVFVCFGYRAGILKTFVGFFSYFISVVVSALINPSVSAFIRKTFVADMVYDFVLKRVGENKLPESGVFARFSGMINEEIANGVSTLLINIISFAAAVIICRIILHFISKTVKIISKLPVVSSVNKLCGAVLGGLEGILILYILFVLILFIPQGSEKAITKEIDNSRIAKKFYTENIITDILGKDVLNIE